MVPNHTQLTYPCKYNAFICHLTGDTAMGEDLRDFYIWKFCPFCGYPMR